MKKIFISTCLAVALNTIGISAIAADTSQDEMPDWLRIEVNDSRNYSTPSNSAQDGMPDWLRVGNSATSSYSNYKSYDNITNEVLQIEAYINQGLYLEAMQSCDNTKRHHTISDADIAKLNTLYYTAKNKYESYQSSIKGAVSATPPQQDEIPDWLRIENGIYGNGYKYITNEVNQINAYISQGLYLEAMQLCESTKQKFISESDKEILDGLYKTASKKYNIYKSELNKQSITNEERLTMFNTMKSYMRFDLQSQAAAIWPDPYNDDRISYYRQTDGSIKTYIVVGDINKFGGYSDLHGSFLFDCNLNVINYKTY